MAQKTIKSPIRGERPKKGRPAYGASKVQIRITVDAEVLKECDREAAACGVERPIYLGVALRHRNTPALQSFVAAMKGGAL